MANAVLRFDVGTSRWECLTGDFSSWVTEQDVTPLLRIGRDASDRVAGFVFDFDRDSESFAESLEAIRRDFGDDISLRVANEPTTDTEVVIPEVGMLATTPSADGEVMRPSRRMQRAAAEVVITDDNVAGVVTVTMTVPWWARFMKPWVAVRRRGKRDILLAGPLRIRGRTAKATLRYGMPYSGSTLTADVVKGPRSRAWILIVAATVAAAVLALGLVRNNPGGVIEVQPSQECQGRFCILSVEFGRGPGCMQAGDTFTQFGDGFLPEDGLPIVFFIPGVVQAPLPGGAVLRVPVTVISRTAVEGVIPQAAAFAIPPVAGQMVSIVVSNGDYGVSTWGSGSFPWCG